MALQIVRGLPETLAAFKRVQVEVAASAPLATRAGAQVLAATMVAKAPKRTGKLASSIRVTQQGDTAFVGADVPYARFVEFGTTFMAAQPFEEEAADETATAIGAAVAGVLKGAIR